MVSRGKPESLTNQTLEGVAQMGLLDGKKEVVVKQSTAVISVEQELADQAKNAALLERPVGGAISLRGGVLAWQGNPVAGNRLPCVVLDTVFENRWYDTPFSAENPSNPACFAISRVEEELGPHEDAEKPQGKDGKCEGCPKNAWGSDPRGGRGKACSQTRRLVLMPANALSSAQDIQKSEVAILKLPVTSVRYWSAYVNQLAGTVKRPPYAVVTEIYPEPHPKHQFHVHFTMVKPISNDLIGALREKIALAENYLLAPYAVGQNAEVPVTPASKKF